MAGSLALYGENKVLELIVGKTAFSTPSIFVGLFTVIPTHEDGTGGTECSAGNYVRKSTAGGDWSAASAGHIDNANAIEFVEASGSNWGNVKAFALFDAETTGNMLAWGELDVAKDVDIGDTAKFAANELDITLD